MKARRFNVLSPGQSLPPVGQCIYCGSDDPDLTTEHVIPFGLGGRLKLPKSSCEKCRVDTHGFETDVLRGMLRDFREASGYPSRHRKDRRTHIQRFRRSSDGLVADEIPASEYPRILMLIALPKPGVLVGRDPTLPVRYRRMVALHPEDKAAVAGMQVTRKLQNRAFCRMIAKIGHAYAMCCSGGPRGLAGYDLLLSELIREGTGSPQHLVGTDEEMHRPVRGLLHELGLQLETHESGQFLVARVRLFASYGAPCYMAVVGKKITQ